jgi:hypothetical protein
MRVNRFANCTCQLQLRARLSLWPVEESGDRLLTFVTSFFVYSETRQQLKARHKRGTNEAHSKTWSCDFIQPRQLPPLPPYLKAMGEHVPSGEFHHPSRLQGKIFKCRKDDGIEAKIHFPSIRSLPLLYSTVEYAGRPCQSPFETNHAGPKKRSPDNEAQGLRKPAQAVQCRAFGSREASP